MLKNTFRHAVTLMAVAGFALVGSLGSARAEYPEKPITMVIPLGAGGSHDLNARVITSIIPQYLNQAMIVRSDARCRWSEGNAGSRKFDTRWIYIIVYP